jgi:hypothetical protein
MASGAQDQQFEIGIITRRARALDTVQLLQIELVVGDPATHVGEQLALVIGQGRGLLQDAGAAAVVDHQTALLIAWLEQQLAVSGHQLALQAGLTHMGRAFLWAIEQLAGGEQRKHGNKHQGTGNTHL